MFIDSLAGVIPPQTADVKLEKKEQTDQPRPIVGSEKSQDSKLEMSKQNLSKKNAMKPKERERVLRAAIYNPRGSFSGDPPVELENTSQSESLDLVV